MVVHLSSKLGHIAQSLRPQHHLHSLRSAAFPSTTHTHAATPGFFDSTNVFVNGGNAASAAQSSSSNPTIVAERTSASAGPEHGGASTGGARGSKWHAGSRQPNWAFQTARLNSQAPASVDVSSRLNNDEEEEVVASHGRPALSRSKSLLSRRTTSISSPVGHVTAAEQPLLTPSETGLSRPSTPVQPLISRQEMQRRYRSAFGSDRSMTSAEASREQELLAMEADEMDLMEQLQPQARTRRSSFGPAMSSPSARPLLVGPLGRAPTAGLSARALSTRSEASSPKPSENATPPFPAGATPPQADVPLVRRNSTSAAVSKSETTAIPTSALDPLDFPRKQMLQAETRPPATAPEDLSRRPLGQTAGSTNHFSSPEAMHRHNAILHAQKQNNFKAVDVAVLHYTAVRDSYSTHTHNAAMEALRKTRVPGSPIRRIVELYSEMFNNDKLRPTRETYNIILKTLCTREVEVQRQIGFMERRVKKKKLAARARGPWDSEKVNETYLLEGEQAELDRLRNEDYLTPAIEIYKSIGKVADQLTGVTVSHLINAAAGRKRIDLALSIFSRLERSPYQKVPASVYYALIKMYGADKDVASVKEVFEAYLTARQNGLHIVKAPVAQYRLVAQKHNHVAHPEYTIADPADGEAFTLGDAAMWRTCIQSLFAAGDAEQAVAVLQRMLDAIEQASANKTRPPRGYPAALESDILATVVVGFINAGDAQSAKTWFDRGNSMTSGDVNGVTSLGPHMAYYTRPFYAAIDTDFHDLLNHIYRTMIARSNEKRKLTIPDFMTALDYNLARFWAADAKDLASRQATLDAVLEFRKSFENAVRQGLVDAAPRDFEISTGALSRIAIACGAIGRYDDAATVYVDFVKAVARASDFAETESEAVKRSAQRWILVASDTPAAGALGMQPDTSSTKFPSINAIYPAENRERPPIKAAATIVAALNKLRESKEWFGVPKYEVAVVESYLQSKERSGGDVKQLGLSGRLWYTVIEAFASVSAQVARGLELSFEFPGFEPIIDDFAAAGAKVPSHEMDFNYDVLVKLLRMGGMSRERTMAVLSVVDQHLAETIDLGAAVDAASATETPADVTESATVLPDQATVDANLAELPESASESEQAQSTAATSLPTPPATPPTYFAELPPAQFVAPEAPSIDRALSHQVDSLAFGGKTDEAVKLAMEQAQQGRFAHPETFGRLIETLGREGKPEVAKQVYLLAYSVLPALASDPAAQSLAWVALEDHMIIALAQSGQLTEVGYHRDRLLQAGSAPSADGYAAMILNMKETTDDAAVALMLFEESQRFRVTPNVYLFNTLISKLSRARRATEALEYFELMKSHGLTPSSITYGAIINACCKTGDDLSADYLFQEMTASPKFKPRVPPYNTMMQFYTSTKPDRQRALHYYDALVAAGVPPTGHTYKLLLDAYGSIGEPDIRSMEDVFTTLVRDRAVTVTGAHWASLINAYGSVAKNLERAIAVFDSIEKHPSTVRSRSQLPDAVVYEALLNALLANERADLCDKYLTQMKHRGVRMTAYVANTLIKGHATQKNMEAARQVFESLADPPSGVAAAGNHSVDRHPKHSHQQQQQRPGQVQGQGQSQQQSTPTGPVYREPSTWETMIKCEIAAGESERAVQLMRRVEQRAFPEAVVARIRKQLSEVGLETVS